ncbi:TBC1 domain family member 13-like [Branchiostoma lanceolatum]|uniref:TBC1 domain family member 13-like n=1 Tax=Branchiostoma lanceolatum TaxID=7740 RepID=UPI0034517F6B
MAAYRARLKEFEDCLETEKIDLKHLRSLCFQGIPDGRGLRSKCWKILLNYLPPLTTDWTDFLKKQRALYQQLLEELIITPGKQQGSGNSREDVTFADHPLNPNPDSQWSQYFKDNDVLLQIDKDVRRLCPDISFFQQATDHPCERLVNAESGIETLRKRVEHTILKAASVGKNRLGITVTNSTRRKVAVEEYETLPEGQEAHWEVVERILFLYAKLNPGQGYVQGMNEIIGPVYYLFASDPNKEWQEHAEADTFFCFTNLMSEIRDNFIKMLDDSASGIGSGMQNVLTLLKKHDQQLWRCLEEREVRPQFYLFRWLTLLLSQEFKMPDVIRVWDSLFADRQRFDFLYCVCCAMIICIRSRILEGDFSDTMRTLQNYPDGDIHVVLRKAVEICPS